VRGSRELSRERRGTFGHRLQHQHRRSRPRARYRHIVLRPWIETLIAGPACACWLDSHAKTGSWLFRWRGTITRADPARPFALGRYARPAAAEHPRGRPRFWRGEAPRCGPHPREAIEPLLAQGVRLGVGGLSQTEFCQRVVDRCGVERGCSGFSDSAILHKAYDLQRNRG
jgi:hypothetical protein